MADEPKTSRRRVIGDAAQSVAWSLASGLGGALVVYAGILIGRLIFSN